MNIKNRNADIVSLRCHVCQAFLKMVVVDGWREKLELFLQVQVNSLHKDNYIEQYKMMRKSGIENYSIDDMDVPFISNAVYYCPNLAIISKATKKAIHNLKEDRHTTNHSSENEPDEELYLRALISLRNLQDFLFTVDLNETQIPNEQRRQFVQNYSKKIDELKLAIYNDCIELFQIKKDIALILASDDQDKLFCRVNESYLTRWGLSDDDKARIARFYIEASNAGIKSAHINAAIVYASQKDYDEATRRYEMLVQTSGRLSDDVAHSITKFFNEVKMRGANVTDRMLKLVSVVKEQGFDIIETEQGIIWNSKRIKLPQVAE